MLLTLALLLLLTPFPSFQTPTNEGRHTTGSETSKPNAAFTLSKPKTTAAVNRQTIRPTLKPNTVNQTTSTPRTTKSKPSLAVIQTTPIAAVKTTTVSGTNTNSQKHTVSVNQTALAKATRASNSKTTKEKIQPAPTGVQNVQTTSTKSALARGVTTTKNKPTASFNQSAPAKSSSTSDAKSPKDKPDKATSSANQTAVVKPPATTATKEKPAASQQIKVVISDGCESTKAKEQELKLKPGAPLVMTHKISLLPGGCNGGCEDEMAALKGRVARLEMEMSSFKEKCSCSANCPRDCSGNGECQKGKCVCQQGFMGSDCSKCAQGAKCNNKTAKGKVQVKVETVTLQLSKDKENMQEKHTQAEQTLFQRKDQKKGSDAKVADTKPKVATGAKAKHESSVKKITIKDSSTATKTSHPTIGQVLLKHKGRKQEEARKGETTVLTSKKVVQRTDFKVVKDVTISKTNPKSEQLKDQPHVNVTVGYGKKSNGTAKIATILTKVPGTNKTRTEKETLEQSTLTEKNATQSSGQKRIKVKVETSNAQSVDHRNTENSKTGKDKGAQRSQYLVNATTADEAQILQDQTTTHSSGSVRKVGGSGLGSVKVVNISSYSFTITWSAPQGMFKNFTLVRREPRADGEEEDHDEFEGESFEKEKVTTAKNTTEVQVQSESLNSTAASGTAIGSKGKSETKRISMVVPGNVRSVEFSNLRANTGYVLQVYGTTAERQSKIHRVTAITGPEPATDMVFSNVTESSLTVTWTKPKTTFSGIKVTYTNIVTGESRFVTVDSQQSYVVLSKLPAGSSFIITVTTTHGRLQSDSLTSIITTVPGPPTHLQVVNVTDTRALLQWTPSLGKVDRFIISYESSKTPNVTVTVMLSGNSVEHQLRGLQRGTLHTVKVLSQKDSLQSMAISTSFTTANVVKASEVGARTAVIAWRTTTIVYHSYRLIYQVAGEETKELTLDSSITEYKLTGLLPMSRYIVLVQGEKDGHYTSVVTTEFVTGKLRFPFPTECSQELLNGALQSGEVDIYPQGKDGRAVRVYCDMETDGGGWTVFQRRMNGKTDFYRTWSEYSAGFGNLSEEFWLGNELLHNLTSVGPVSLRVDMRSGNDTAYAHYANFSIDSAERHYSLEVSGYTGTAGDSMRYHNGRPFSTRDKDPDSLGIHCARSYIGGWWYKNCYKTNLNGLYGMNSNNKGIVWIDWKGKDSSIPFTEMKFRPSRFSPATHG